MNEELLKQKIKDLEKFNAQLHDDIMELYQAYCDAINENSRIKEQLLCQQGQLKKKE